jgi:mRNA deadenylase 3'-5' endonuclease subunit Ccr4
MIEFIIAFIQPIWLYEYFKNIGEKTNTNFSKNINEIYPSFDQNDNSEIFLDDLIFDEDFNGKENFAQMDVENNIEKQKIEKKEESNFLECNQELDDLIMFHIKSVEEEEIERPDETNCNTMMTLPECFKKEDKKEDLEEKYDPTNEEKLLNRKRFITKSKKDKKIIKIKKPLILKSQRVITSYYPKHNEIDDQTSLIKISDNKLTTISVLTYNILNQIYMKKPNRNDLSLENRMSKIISELSLLKSDIICLQEADLMIYKQFISNSLNEYSFVYGVNCGSSFINIIGYKKNRFKFISFKNFSLLDIKVNGNRGVMNLVLERSEDRQIVSIYNLHLPWREELQRIEIIERIYNHMQTSQIENILLVGDFNSEPTSHVVDLIQNGHINDSPIKSFRHNSKYEIFDKMKEIYNFSSAYKNYRLLIKGKKYLKFQKNYKNLNPGKLDYHPKFTSCTEYFQKTIDYIFFSKNFKLKSILRLPLCHELLEEGFLPSNKFPSDHLKLYAEFTIN